MTHDTPTGADENRRWCTRCELSVLPSADDGEDACPACGSELE